MNYVLIRGANRRTDRQTYRERERERAARSDAYFILARLVYNVKHVLIRADVKNSF